MVNPQITEVQNIPELTVRKSRLRAGESRMAYLFVSPAMILFFIFSLLPAGYALVLSFTNYDILNLPSWVGLANYQRMFQDAVWIQSLQNILYYVALYVPTMVIVSLLVALALNRKMPGMKVFRTLYYLPVISSTVAASSVWMFLYNENYGVINQILGIFGINGPAWLFNENTAMIAVVIVCVWQGIGGNMIIYLAGLQGVPDYLYEAAVLDGASKWQTFRYVTWPSLRTTTFFVTTTSLIGSFQVFDQVYVMTQGGPGNTTLTPVYNIYNNGFQQLQMGYASAQAFGLFVIIMIVSFINLRINRDQNLV